jgi:hypothetical protein
MPDDALETEVAAGNMLSDAGMHEQAIEHFRIHPDRIVAAPLAGQKRQRGLCRCRM